MIISHYLLILLSCICFFPNQTYMKNPLVYKVYRLHQPMFIDSNWDKPQWQNIKPLEIKNHMGDLPEFILNAQAKMMYDEENLYVIFKVYERFVHCVTRDYNGPVWEDSCVEFFFSPDKNLPEQYFNLEINCGGTPLMHYNIVPRKDIKVIDIEDIKKVEIAHSMPQIVDPEMTEPTTWTVEYKIPLAMLTKYAEVTKPEYGVIWRANFYKIAVNSSNPHYLTWSHVKNDKPDFHLPQYFGKLIFQ
jgi:hypothetical protein